MFQLVLNDTHSAFLPPRFCHGGKDLWTFTAFSAAILVVLVAIPTMNNGSKIASV